MQPALDNALSSLVPTEDAAVFDVGRKSRVRPGSRARFYRRVFTAEEVNAAERVLRARPTPLRMFDQINMRAGDLLKQASLIAPHVQDKSVAFVGDMDGTATLLGLLRDEVWPCPARMLLLDFDERLLEAVSKVSQKSGLGRLLELEAYNVFHPLPGGLVARYDWFYTNPPYGRYNRGASARLFITRGCELCSPPDESRGSGCLILPDDRARPWTQLAWRETADFLSQHGWQVKKRHDNAHRYHLDDDRELSSCMMHVQRRRQTRAVPPTMEYAGRAVGLDEIPNFYGRSVRPPYPRYIRSDGTEDYNWQQETSE